ncbi:MAG: hypothetical protein A3D31_17910 [Candidatus Fluviicola riflensis]|nr:MAG: hypothetical protein CHH17_02850 [Candidatus Fluviicola riflensis]OGS76860.1 MAG: hypothetical protein A3D31_17910 [Candidatus Fluviicola riflensis]OGS81790.1 MAG: hypothetical protein A2724_15310 [Fluviicola sp. RIFCSPHIGHO2_01_FULL_43_53]OGS88589.1 MAG: hypothetical protein A3E30_07420 [Fluviicola sp. RIFCSPHIGHO2_12_FULL_43_24]
MVNIVKGLIIVSTILVSLPLFGQNEMMIPSKKGQLWGFSDTLGVLKIPAIYDTVYFFEDGEAKVVKNKLSGYINQQHKVIIPCSNNSCKRIQFNVQVNDLVVRKSHYLIKRNGKYGILDHTNTLKLALIYDHVQKLDSDFFLVKRNKLYGLIKRVNEEYKLIIPISYLSVKTHEFDGYIACEKTDGGMSYFDFSGKLIPDFSDFINRNEYATVEAAPTDFKSTPRYSIYKKEGKTGLVKYDGRKNGDTIPFLADSILDVSYLNQYSYLIVMKDDKWGVISDNGLVLLEFEYDYLHYKNVSLYASKPFDHLFSAKKADKWGLVANNKGNPLQTKVLIDFECDTLIEFGRDFLIVKQQENYGVYNKAIYQWNTTLKYKKISPDWVYSRMDLILFYVQTQQGDWIYVDKNGREYYAAF